MRVRVLPVLFNFQFVCFTNHNHHFDFVLEPATALSKLRASLGLGGEPARFNWRRAGRIKFDGGTQIACVTSDLHPPCTRGRRVPTDANLSSRWRPRRRPGCRPATVTTLQVVIRDLSAAVKFSGPRKPIAIFPLLGYTRPGDRGDSVGGERLGHGWYRTHKATKDRVLRLLARLDA